MHDHFQQAVHKRFEPRDATIRPKPSGVFSQKMKVCFAALCNLKPVPDSFDICVTKETFAAEMHVNKYLPPQREITPPKEDDFK